ncbi:Rossmann-like domain-containing protein [Desulfotignum phosphitoxidans]|uniref:Heavy-metal chelation domain-containing protein n=1 Tax=Desulfotignum phosphitoxidans DSM 13687 TaxID=1286635 RepID=S0G388_9BACT|nr:DUF364 domain-containing protein [Desulfotignum phosphitoxidans]EMS78206.1 hypothetical protein Dpo_9c00380 [Desulfotignum phosphitoxidans DSM 13687]
MTTLQEEIIAEVTARATRLDAVPDVRMVAISLGYTFVELDNGIMGVCFTPRSDSGPCAHYSGAGALSEKPLLALCPLMQSSHPLERSVGVAAVNALSHSIMAQDPDQYRFSEKDFLDLLLFDPDESNKVGMVGHIGPFISFLKKRADSLVVVDDNPDLKIGVMEKGPVITRDVNALKNADIVIITGSSAAVGGFDAALDAAQSARFIGVVGPSAGWLPQPAFRRGVHAVAATKITDLVGARRTILEGGGTPQFIEYGQKYTLIPG